MGPYSRLGSDRSSATHSDRNDEQGRINSGPASDIVHTIEPLKVTVINEFDNPLADLLLTVEEPGDYTIKSEINGEVFDYLEVRFDAPDELG